MAEYLRLGTASPDAGYGPASLRSEAAESILKAALSGVPRIHVDADLRGRVKEAIDTADPIGLLAIGAPSDEYDPEVDHVAALAAIGQLTAESAWAVFAYWFSETAISRDDPRLTAIASVQT